LNGQLAERTVKAFQQPPDERTDSQSGADLFLAEFPEQNRASGRWDISAWVFGLLALATLILVVLHLGRIEEFTRLAAAASPSWFLLACVAQVSTYVCAALV